MSRPLAAAALLAAAVVLDGAGAAQGRRRVRALRPSAPRAAALPPWPERSAPDVAQLAAELAAVVRAGAAPARAWELIAAGSGSGARVAAGVAEAVAAGAEVPDAVRAQARLPTRGAVLRGPRVGRRRGGGDALAWLALALAVCDRSGAPVGDVLERFADALRAQEAASAERAAVLAGPRATAAVLGLLPLAGVGLGLLVGADPLATLLGTAAGRACLLAGGVLWAAGLWWTARMVAGAAAAGTA